MNKKIKYTDEPLGNIEVVRDFLPHPSELAYRDEEQKITLTLSKRSVDFFKSVAAEHHTSYQPIIRRLIDAYVSAHQA